MALLKGIVHGKTVELEEESGLPEGQAVSVILDPLITPEEAIRRSAGGWAEDADQLDEFLEQMRRSRKQERLPSPP